MKEAEEAKIRSELLGIDWHEWVLAETIVFTKDDDEIALQKPIDFSKRRAEQTLDSSLAVYPVVELDEDDMEVDGGINDFTYENLNLESKFKKNLFILFFRRRFCGDVD